MKTTITKKTVFKTTETNDTYVVLNNPAEDSGIVDVASVSEACQINNKFQWDGETLWENGDEIPFRVVTTIRLEKK